jgi:hypothetical protein
MRVVAGVIGVAAIACLTLVPLCPAGAQNTGPPTAAVLTPTLETFAFGDVVGLPLACDLVGSVLPVASPSLTPLSNDLTAFCQTLSAEGDTELQKGIAASSQASAINPLVNPLLAALAAEAVTLGQTDGAQLGPLGPTVAGLGQTISYFEGSSN